MSRLKLPERGDVIRKDRWGGHWYAVILHRGPVQIFDGSMVDGVVYRDGITDIDWSASIGISGIQGDDWCYADPNRLDHQDIPEAIWILRKRILAGEIP